MRNNLFLQRVGLAVAGLVGLSATVSYAGPTPIGTSTTTLTYQTAAGEVSLSATTDYSGQATSDAIPLTGNGASNARTFNSVNSFGRRMFVVNSGLSGDPFDDVLRPNESQIAHAFFKMGDNLNGDYFPGISPGSSVTMHVEGLTFTEPAFVDLSTVMLHTLWSAAQTEELGNPYINLHDHRTLTDPFRNMDAFAHPSINVFNSLGGTANYVLNDELLDFELIGNGTTELDLTLTFSYEALRNLEEGGQVVPDGLPAPQGFLEPFHFHLEYVVAPEPATLLLLGVGGVFAARRRNRGRQSA